MTAGGPRKKDGDVRFKVRPVMIRDRLLFQMETFRGNQAFHRNLNEEEACEAICEAMTGFRQLSIKTEGFEAEAMVSKKGKVTVRKRVHEAGTQKIAPDVLPLAHNRKKKYILEEGHPVPFLIDLGGSDAGWENGEEQIR